MKKIWTRRKFLETGLKKSMAVGTSGLAAFVPLAAVREVGRSRVFQPDLRDTLRAVMDEIIPASDGMPSASEVGGEEYLERVATEDSAIKAQLERSLKALNLLSERQLGKRFSMLPKSGRVAVLERMEEEKDSEPFSTMRDFTYEAYYTNSRVWKLIGYEFYPTEGAGPRMKPFDESILGNVRRKGKLYREVG